MTDPKAAAGLITSPTLEALTTLDLEGPTHRRGRESLAGLAGALPDRPCRAPTLRILELRQNRLTPADAEALTRCPAVRGLVSLAVGENEVGSAGVAAVAAGPWERLTVLALGENGIDERGAEAVAGSSALAGLQSLDLYGNPLGSAGGLALARGHLGRLRHLDVRVCKLDRPALAELKRRFRGKGRLVS
jgi:hypothetical protein